MFFHSVYFYASPTAPADAGARIVADCRELLATIPGVRYVHAGTTAGTPRDVVDNSYMAALVVVLDDAAAHDVYQTHARHLEFIARNSANWSRVQVYDFVE